MLTGPITQCLRAKWVRFPPALPNMIVNLSTYELIDVEDLFRQIDFLATSATIHTLRNHATALDGSVTILRNGKTEDKQWHIKNINRHLDILEKNCIAARLKFNGV